MRGLFTGEYSICHYTMQADSDGFDYRTLRWDYDTAEEAQADLAKVAAEAGVAVDDCVVIRAYWQSHGLAD